jgi:hypothetical protein
LGTLYGCTVERVDTQQQRGTTAKFEVAEEGPSAFRYAFLCQALDRSHSRDPTTWHPPEATTSLI